MRYSFADCVLDTDAVTLTVHGSSVPVQPQVVDVLALLIDERERVVPKADILDRVWGERFVSESALTSRIKSARQAIGDDGQSQRLIRTVHGRGYQFVGDLVVSSIAPTNVPDRRVLGSRRSRRDWSVATATSPASSRCSRRHGS